MKIGKGLVDNERLTFFQWSDIVTNGPKLSQMVSIILLNCVKYSQIIIKWSGLA